MIIGNQTPIYSQYQPAQQPEDPKKAAMNCLISQEKMQNQEL